MLPESRGIQLAPSTRDTPPVVAYHDARATVSLVSLSLVAEALPPPPLPPVRKR